MTKGLRRRFWKWLARKVEPHVQPRYGLAITNCHIDTNNMGKLLADLDQQIVGQIRLRDDGRKDTGIV